MAWIGLIVGIVVGAGIGKLPGALALKGLWGSFFSRRDGAAMSNSARIIRRAFSRVELEASAPWAPAVVTPEGLQSEVQRMRGDRK